MKQKSRNYRKVISGAILSCAILLSAVPATAFAGDSFTLADTLPLNESYSDTLQTKTDVNYYKFTTSNSDSYYKVELRNTEATDFIGLTLYSGEDATTNIYDFVADTASVNSDIRKLESNHTYYIAIKNPYSYVGEPTGNYKLSVTEIKDDVADNFDNSKSIPLNKKVAYNLQANADSDYFKFTTTKNNSYYKIELANSEATGMVNLALYSANDSTTKEFDLQADKARIASNVVKLQKNHTYYLLTSKYSSYQDTTGKYKLKVTEIKDDAPEAFASSTNIALNKKCTYKLNVDGDVDYFKFKTTRKGSYTITLANKSGTESINADIYSNNDATQKIDTISSSKSARNSKRYNLKANHTYYIAVAKSYSFYNVTGAYSITVNH